MNRKRGEMEQASLKAKCTENDLKCEIGKQEKEILREITVFTAKWCGACKIRVPQILKKAKAAGLEVKLIDVDNAESKYRKTLKHVHFVPHIDYMCHEIDEDELDRLCQGREHEEA